MPYLIVAVFLFCFTCFIICDIYFFFYKKNLDKTFVNKGFSQQSKLRNQIFECLVNEAFEVNHLNHYKFYIDNEIHVYGIVSLVDIYGVDLFRNAKKVREERKMKKNDNVFSLDFSKK